MSTEPKPVGTGLDRLRTLTRLLDDLVRIPGTRLRFGLDPLLGLVPGGGDAVGAVVSAYALLVAVRVGAPAAVLLRMCGNIVLDTVAGTVPILGDLFDFGWKANRRNLTLLERYHFEPTALTRRSKVLLGSVLALLGLVLVGALVGGFFLLRGVLARL
jgi:hypothetical protein